MIFSKIAEHSKIRTVHLAEHALIVSKYQNRNDELGMIGILAFNAIKTFKAARIKLLKKVGIKKHSSFFRSRSKILVGNSRC